MRLMRTGATQLQAATVLRGGEGGRVKEVAWRDGAAAQLTPLRLAILSHPSQLVASLASSWPIGDPHIGSSCSLLPRFLLHMSTKKPAAKRVVKAKEALPALQPKKVIVNGPHRQVFVIDGQTTRRGKTPSKREQRCPSVLTDSFLFSVQTPTS